MTFASPGRIPRIILETLMIVDMAWLMSWGRFYLGDLGLIHEILGISLILLFVIHIFWNRRWFARLPRGRYDLKRTILTCVDLLLVVMMILLLISSLALSRHLFTDLHPIASFTARKIHIFAPAWLLLLSGLHLGIHLGGIKRHIIYLIPAVFGASSFIYLRFWEMLWPARGFSYGPHVAAWYYFIGYLLVFALAALAGAELARALKRKKSDSQGELSEEDFYDQRDQYQ